VSSNCPNPATGLANQQPMYSNESTSGPKPQFEMGQLTFSIRKAAADLQTRREKIASVISLRKCHL
jgi:hypothetical protein